MGLTVAKVAERGSEKARAGEEATALEKRAVAWMVAGAFRTQILEAAAEKKRRERDE